MNDQQPANFPDNQTLSTPGQVVDAVALTGEHDDGSPEALSYKPVSEKSVSLDRLIGYVVMCVVMLIVVCSTAPLFLIPKMPWWGVGAIIAGWFALGAVLFFFAQVHPQWAFERTRWALTDEGFEILRGIVWRHHIAIPAARVQHVDVSQGPLQRIYDLGTITLHTAGTANASVELGGLEHAVALRLRDELVRQKEMLDDAE